MLQIVIIAYKLFIKGNAYCLFMVNSTFQLDSILPFVDTAIFSSCRLESPQCELVFIVKYNTHALYSLQSVILKAFTRFCETEKRNYILNQLFCLPAQVCCSTWERNKSMFSSPLPSWNLGTSKGKLPKSGDFQRSTKLFPSSGSKTPFCSLWLTVATAAQKQLWRGYCYLEKY